LCAAATVSSVLFSGVPDLRVELAKASIAQSTRTFTQIAEDAGFGSAERMRHAFLRILGLPPQALRRTLG
jgi:transcriptional regulator GlxA family with amidase domain